MNQDSSNLYNNIHFHYISPDEDNDRVYVGGACTNTYNYQSNIFDSLERDNYAFDLEGQPPYYEERAFSPSRGEFILSQFQNNIHSIFPQSSGFSKRDLVRAQGRVDQVDSYLRTDLSECIRTYSQVTHGSGKFNLDSPRSSISRNSNNQSFKNFENSLPDKKLLKQIFKIQKGNRKTLTKRLRKDYFQDDQSSVDRQTCNNGSILSKTLSLQLSTMAYTHQDQESTLNLINQVNFKADNTRKSQQDEDSKKPWISSTPSISNDVRQKMESVGFKSTFEKVLTSLQREEIRHLKSNAFRQRRRELKRELSERQQVKNKNRQEAAKKRVRDNNGKFQERPENLVNQNTQNDCYFRTTHNLIPQSATGCPLNPTFTNRTYSPSSKDDQSKSLRSPSIPLLRRVNSGQRLSPIVQDDQNLKRLLRSKKVRKNSQEVEHVPEHMEYTFTGED
ncbi:UNKNOWN [Stylonychia lemnae]|uniref:Uncharacterized protein n=1 Tax=Stylonychia lemnae TaxID=5949 RepID=A0A078B9M5_STYLE|nr:UNKNOWN [Stylonychia lemnae]|eukprot:CDW91139.1 UNKNOWN [Stylonychia lemnae]